MNRATKERVEDRWVPYVLRRNKMRVASGWTPRSMRRKNKSALDGNRKAKRSRLGNRQQRAIYTSAHGYRHPDYPAICRRASKLNGK